ncbi:uncharacterized protein LOC101900565 [Musca domestica]|uniref:Uncharacterized protein LOC101900565 n=1 Tax=Musca domestica TaxID=7370 RepID=A0A1I8M2W3_MUSDO|nr:uncharacterized protein LOC101900565 [Musca domestica]
MSDIYDYAYIHVMRHPVETNKYSITSSSPPKHHQQPQDEEKELQPEREFQAIPEELELNEVSTDDFSPRDLQIFVDSLETISRLEQARHERRQRRRKSKKSPSHNVSNTKRMVTCLDSSIVEEGDVGSSFYSNCESDYIYDETYGGATSVGQCSGTLYSNITTNSIRSDLPPSSPSSDSEESGVFLDQTSDSHVYENIDPIRPRSKVVSHAKNKSLKSRLIALIMKKQYARPAAPSTEMLSSTTIGEQFEETEIYDRVINEAIHQQFVKNPKKGKKKYASKSKSESQPEEKFLDKAMRFLTL